MNLSCNFCFMGTSTIIQHVFCENCSIGSCTLAFFVGGMSLSELLNVIYNVITVI